MPWLKNKMVKKLMLRGKSKVSEKKVVNQQLFMY